LPVKAGSGFQVPGSESRVQGAELKIAGDSSR
jgi:hypothetical protein